MFTAPIVTLPKDAQLFIDLTWPFIIITSKAQLKDCYFPLLPHHVKVNKTRHIYIYKYIKTIVIVSDIIKAFVDGFYSKVLCTYINL